MFLGTVLNEYYIILILILNIFLLFILIAAFVSYKNSKKKWNKINDYLDNVTKTVNSVRYGDLSKNLKEMDIPDIENLTDSLNRMIDTLRDRETMIVEYQNELSRQNKMLQAALDSLSDGLIVTDCEGKIFRASKKIAQWFEVDGKILPNKLLNDFIEIPNNKTLQDLDDSEIIITKNKTQHYTASTVELKLDDNTVRYIIIVKNITDQFELETVKEDFIATLTHDLKVPIIAETNMIELFLNGNFGTISDKQKQALKHMQSSNKELLDFVQVVLDTYKVQGNKIILHKENIMLKSFISEIITEMQPIAHKTNNELIFAPKRDIRILADKFQLKRVVKNLIQNAISYGEANTPIDINIGEIPGYIVIKIRDHGAGISKKDLAKIFDKYYSAAKKFRKIGTGLGLYLALQITKAHNGVLDVESEEGEFTEFCIKIPA